MGGFIKCTLREKDKITTRVLSTNVINGFLSDYKNIFENDISELIIKNAIGKKSITEEFHSQQPHPKG